MATPERAGWFDDPENTEQLRYFDGILWTDHVTPRRTRWDQPTEGQGGESVPSAAVPDPGRGGVSSGFPAAPVATRAGAHARSTGPTTEDGVPLAPYGLRVGAFLIDAVITSVLGMIAGGWFLWRAVEPVLQPWEEALAARDAGKLNEALALMDARQLGYYTAISLLVTLVYHMVFLTRWSATVGKLLVGISIRRTSHPGVLDFSAASRRVAFVVLLSAVSNLPLVGFLGLSARFLDVIWPLSDRRRQAIHDKVADTVVVMGRQGRP